MIDTVVFDIGNVLAEWHWRKNFTEMFGEALVDTLADATVRSPQWLEMDRGALSEAEMVELLARNAPQHAKEVERIVRANPDHIVLVDEAYVDFGGESALPLLASCPNLLIVRTFSKSRSLAGARLGYALANAPVIEDLNRVRYSFHPYNINRLSMLAGIEAMRDTAYFESCVQSVVRQRGETAAELRGLGFSMTDSRANFLFAAHPALTARGYYEALKARGVLIRCWDDPALREHVRISIGTREQMRRLVLETRAILSERTIS